MSYVNCNVTDRCFIDGSELHTYYLRLKNDNYNYWCELALLPLARDIIPLKLSRHDTLGTCEFT